MPPLASQVEFLKSAGFGDVGALVAKEPSLVMMARESLEPKLQFVLKDMGRSIEEIESFPAVLNYSLQHLEMRHAFLEKHGPGQDGFLYLGTSHDGWKSRRDAIAREIEAITAAGTLDWTPYFAAELAAARDVMRPPVSR